MHANFCDSFFIMELLRNVSFWLSIDKTIRNLPVEGTSSNLLNYTCLFCSDFTICFVFMIAQDFISIIIRPEAITVLCRTLGLFLFCSVLPHFFMYQWPTVLSDQSSTNFMHGHPKVFGP